MLYLIRTDEPEPVIKELRENGHDCSAIVISHNNESVGLMEWIAKRLLADPMKKIVVICSDVKGWTGLTQLAGECGHGCETARVYDPRVN